MAIPRECTCTLAEPILCTELVEAKAAIMASVEEIQWRTSRHTEGLKERFMGAICPASLHTCHPYMKELWVLLRGLWLSLFQGPRPSRSDN